MSARDVVVVGAGPAGMAAAAAAAEAGAGVVMVDDNPAPGGQIWRGDSADAVEGEPHGRAFAALMRRVRAARVEIRSGTRVVEQPFAGVIRLEDDSGCTDLKYERLIVATGARERFLPFPGWTLPGVLGAGGLQAMVKAGLPISGKRVVLSGSGPLLLAVAANLAKRGAKVLGVFEQAPLKRLISFGARMKAHPAKLLEGARFRAATIGVPYRTSAWATRALGDGWLRSVTLSAGGRLREITCDYLGCGFNLVPNLELPRLLGCRIDDGYVAVDGAQQSTVAGVYCAGEVTGIGGLEKAMVEGEIAGLAAAGRPAAHLYKTRDRQVRFAWQLEEAFALRPELRSLVEPETIVCRCEDVRFGALEGLRNAREARLHMRCAMGPCQGRICGPATVFLFGWGSESVRPPVMPARTGTLAAESEKSEV